MIDGDFHLSDFLCFAIYSAGHALNRIYKPMLDALGLTYPQYLVLSVLWQEDGQTVGDIGDRLFLDSSTLSPLLKRMESMGYLRRERDRADERVVHVRLTEQGQALRDAARDLPNCIIQASGKSADDLRQMKVEIENLRDAFNRSGRR